MALKYTIALPAPGASDVATREISVTVGDAPATVTQLDGTATTFQFDVPRDQAISLFLVDVDGSGNRSPASATLAFTSRDTVPPPQPGELSVTGVDQTD